MGFWDDIKEGIRQGHEQAQRDIAAARKREAEEEERRKAKLKETLELRVLMNEARKARRRTFHDDDEY